VTAGSSLKKEVSHGSSTFELMTNRIMTNVEEGNKSQATGTCDTLEDNEKKDKIKGERESKKSGCTVSNMDKTSGVKENITHNKNSCTSQMSDAPKVILHHKDSVNEILKSGKGDGNESYKKEVDIYEGSKKDGDYKQKVDPQNCSENKKRELAGFMKKLSDYKESKGNKTNSKEADNKGGRIDYNEGDKKVDNKETTYNN
ncbi:hypothetical protein, conserved, partial [Plasmodium malariae]